MHGNVYEWCSDWYDDSIYGLGFMVDPSGPADGSRRVSRGGGWGDPPQDCRSAHRKGFRPAYPGIGLGFRVASTAVE